ncbi:permease prefix domain 1-containing protein [Dactylosporangium sp. NBC_01737]|uniref:permease prefix domain 1-containing protein n=1 Tax=Dactylosporangium sp. NBC_01737 TaxID=2975959 RepID=UPI002E12E723|nr:permease prefix domain 1-containing protein [Dactylosporangium sp. NBC_01737]
MVIDTYVTSLGAALRGPRAAKRELLTEVRDSLHDAAAHYESTGLPGDDAARMAVDEFGPVRELAPDYQRELALFQGRRTALFVAGAIAVQQVISEVAWRSAATGWHWQPGRGYALLAQTVDYAGYTVVVLGLLAALACGIGSRYVTVGSGFVRATGVAAIGTCAFFVVGGMTLSLLSPAWHTTTTDASPLALASAAITAVTPLWMVLSGLRCLRAAG